MCTVERRLCDSQRLASRAQKEGRSEDLSFSLDTASLAPRKQSISRYTTGLGHLLLNVPRELTRGAPPRCVTLRPLHSHVRDLDLV